LCSKHGDKFWFASVANDATMRAFVASPNSTKANKAKTIVAIFTSALDRALSKQEKTFIDLLLENDRILKKVFINQLLQIRYTLRYLLQSLEPHQLDPLR
jgi:F0F1-type ATP synthase delta subunit